MKKRITTIALVAALAVGQSVSVFAANSPSTRPVISDSGSDGTIGLGGSSSGGGSGSSRGSSTGASAVSSTSALNDTVRINVGQNGAEHTTGTAGTVETNSKGQAVIGGTALEFVQGSDHAVMGLPTNVVSTINSINSGTTLSQTGTGIDLTGYNALIGTHALMTRDSATNAEKTGSVEFPLYVPNLMDGLGTVQVLFYDNFLGQWRLITPNRIDTAAKTLWVTVPNSGTISVVYKR